MWRTGGGEDQTVFLEVTNNGKETLYRLAAIAESEVLDGREFFFGKVAPGETRRFEQVVHLVPGYPTETSSVEFQFRDAGSDDLVNVKRSIDVQGRTLPVFNWEWAFEEVTGNGDGRVDIGEVFQLNLDVTNVAGGPSEEMFARIKNGSGRGLDIIRGTIEPGYMKSEDGSTCEVVKPGFEDGNVIGDLDADPERKAAGDPPEYAEGCKRSLSVGETWSGSFEFKIKELRDEPFSIELTVGDAQAYDHASVVRAEFYGYFSQVEDIAFAAGETPPVSVRNIPPKLEISTQPEARTSMKSVAVSGVATDDVGLAHVMVFAAKCVLSGRPKTSRFSRFRSPRMSSSSRA